MRLLSYFLFFSHKHTYSHYLKEWDDILEMIADNLILFPPPLLPVLLCLLDKYTCA